MAVHRISMNIPNIIDYNLKVDYQISIIFSTNIPDTTGHQMSMPLPTSLLTPYITDVPIK